MIRVVAEALLERRIVGRDDRVARGLGAGAGRGRHGQHRQRRLDELQVAADVLQVVLDRGAFAVGGHGRDGLGQVDGRSAADGQQEVARPGARAGERAAERDRRRRPPARASSVATRTGSTLGAESRSKISPARARQPRRAGRRRPAPGGRASGPTCPPRGGGPSRRRSVGGEKVVADRRDVRDVLHIAQRGFVAA